MSMTPMAVRMVLVEGADGDGVTLDSNVVDGSVGESGCSGAAEQVVAAILGTQESVDEGAHRLTAIGVAWTDHADGKRLRQALRANDIDDVVMVSELHAASALAQAVGRRIGCERTALLFLEGSEATLAVVRTVDGAVVAVQSRVLHTEDIVADLRGMVATLELSAEPPQAVFLMGAGLDVAALAARVAEGTTLPVHAPEDADLALARGAALAAAGTPRFEAETVVVPADVGLVEPGPSDDTAAGATQVAAAGYMAPLGYSAVIDDDDGDDDGGGGGGDDDEAVEIDDDPAERPDVADEKPFLLVGSTLATIFVVGVVALVISLAVSIRPAVDQRPGEIRTPNEPTAASKATDVEPSPALETIEAPVPVVREAPRTAFVPAPAARPQPPVPAAPAAPAPVMPAAPVAPPAAPPPVVTVPAAPAPAPVAAIPPIVLAPVIPVLPPFVQAPIRIPTLPVAPQVTTPMTTAPATTAPTTTVPTSAAPTTTAPMTTAPMTTSAGTTPTTVQSPTSVQTAPTEVSVPTQSTAVSVPSVSTEVSIPTVSAEASVPTVTTEVLIPSTSGAGSRGGDSGSGE